MVSYLNQYLNSITTGYLAEIKLKREILQRQDSIVWELYFGILLNRDH